MKIRNKILSFLFAAAAMCVNAMDVRNPAINADCPDVSLVYDNGSYYMVSTTMHLSPGAPIMRSTDLIHWEIVSYVYDRVASDEKRYSLEDPDGDTAYGQGQWAASLKKHGGKFYCYFVCNRTGGFLYEADRPEGPWRLKSKPGFFHDASLLFDDDGRVYIFYNQGNIDELKADLSGVKEDGLHMRNVVGYGEGEEKALLEGSSVFKKDGWYYLMMISMDWSTPGRLRREVCYRSRTLDNPKWEYKVILETPFETYGGVGQGCAVEGPAGQWSAIIFQDRGGVGRVPCVMPVRWIDGWPMCGDANGKIPNNTAKSYPDLNGIVGSDDFASSTLDLRWQWNHNPVDTAWSLVARPGWLRLTTARPVANLFLAPNTLTQRTVGPESISVVKLDASGMKDGDHAGLAAFNGDSAVIAVAMESGKKFIVMTEEHCVFPKGTHKVERVDAVEHGRAELKGDTAWLRVRCNFRPGNDWAETDWSEDGLVWHRLGKRVKTPFDYLRFFMGTRFALFNYATKTAGGHVDFDKFVFDCEEHERPVAKFHDFKMASSINTGSPLFPGMAPDPAITRKGNDYYLANSSFSYYPGIPVWHSTDLENWDFSGYALSRPSQLNIGEGVGLSAGVFAPDIKYNPYNDTFYLIVTVIGDRGNVVLKSKDPAKGWSAPIKVPVGGIDPSFFFEDDKTAWILNNDDAPDGKAEYPGHRTVRMRKYDLVKDEIIPGTERIIINKGVNPAEKPIWCEGPHLYKIDGTYYVMTAEGGTAQNHSEVIWRSDKVEGPYTPCPVNPILTQRDIKNSVVTSAGHADIFQTPQGDWKAVFLGIMPYRRNGRDWCPIGRSTFLLPVKWIGEGESRQPIILDKGKEIELGPPKRLVEKDSFKSSELDPMWFQIRTPKSKWYSTGDGLSIEARGTSIYERGNPSCLLRWLKSSNFAAEVKVDFTPDEATSIAGLVVYQNEQCNYVLGVTKDRLVLKKHDKNGESVLASTGRSGSAPVRLKTEMHEDVIRFFFKSGGSWRQIGGDEDAKILTTDYAGGFTAAAIGLYAGRN